jgi:hypothetical protein
MFVAGGFLLILKLRQERDVNISLLTELARKGTLPGYKHSAPTELGFSNSF